jgi:K+-sensing histidine kinase KdpD
MLQTDPSISWPQVVKFVRQLNHDIRNHLNAIELQAAFVGEIAAGAETKAEIKRLREMTAKMGEELQRLSAHLSHVKLTAMSYRGSDLIEDLRDRVRNAQGEKAERIDWEIELGDAAIETDPELILSAFAELIENALTHKPGGRPILFRACADRDSLVFTLWEPKTEPVEVPATWGATPLAQVRHGHYALGLFRARSIFEAHHGTLQAHFDPSQTALITTVTLPRARA